MPHGICWVSFVGVWRGPIHGLSRGAGKRLGTVRVRVQCRPWPLTRSTVKSPRRGGAHVGVAVLGRRGSRAHCGHRVDSRRDGLPRIPPCLLLFLQVPRLGRRDLVRARCRSHARIVAAARAAVHRTRPRRHGVAVRSRGRAARRGLPGHGAHAGHGSRGSHGGRSLFVLGLLRHVRRRDGRGEGLGPARRRSSSEDV
jgi:hypothetical protein